MDKKQKEALHYVAVYIVLLGLWPVAMSITNNLAYTAVFGFFIFVGADQLAHRFILGERG